MTNKIIIRGLRHDEWEALLEIRLRAVTAHPDYFQSTLEQTKALPKEQWHSRIETPTSRVFGLFDGEKLIGITNIYIDFQRDPSGQSAHLTMDYIDPAYRGQGFSKLFYQARFAWAREQPNLKKLLIGHREGNEPSRRAILAHGFKYIGKNMSDWPDDSQEYDLRYELDLEKS